MSPQNLCLNVGQLSPLDPPRDVAERGRSCQPIPKVCRTEIETQQT